MSTPPSVAAIIRLQLGASHFEAMTGAKNFLSIGSGLQFDLPARFARHGINKVRIILDPSDTYTVEFYKYDRRTLACPMIAESSPVYADNLREVFTHHTGLDTSL